MPGFVQFCKSHPSVGINKSLLIDPSKALDMADVIDVLGDSRALVSISPKASRRQPYVFTVNFFTFVYAFCSPLIGITGAGTKPGSLR